MKKNKKEDLHREIDLFLIFAIFFIIVFIFIYPSITGLIVYSSTTYNFTFENPDDYTYDSNSILIENNEAKLKLQESTYTWTTINVSEIYVISAYYNGNDKTEKIINIDDKKQLAEDKTFDITFQESLQNNDILALYLNEEKKSLIYLCNISTFCEENYGSIYFPNAEGWYNITIQNLPSSINTLSILTNNSIKVNYIKVIRETEQLNSETNYTYPETSYIETKNINLPTINQNLLFSKEENLNQQELKYYYSSDNGLNWNLIENNSLLSLQQIKIKAEFKTNTASTPIINSMSLTYDSCTESWNCTDWSECYENETKTRICMDVNECGTFELKPSETQNCLYTPSCEENWSCTEWSSCIDENQTRICNDLNFCNITINKPEEIQNCTIQETTTAVTTSSGGGGGGSSGGSSSSSSTFTRPAEKTTEAVTENTKLIETPKQETTPEQTPVQEIKEPEKTQLEKFTGFVTYNIGKDGFNIILLSIIIFSSVGLLTLKLKKNKFKKLKK